MTASTSQGAPAALPVTTGRIPVMGGDGLPQGEGWLVRTGFHDAARARSLLLEVAPHLPPGLSPAALVEALAVVADPDQALLLLLRCLESVDRQEHGGPAQTVWRSLDDDVRLRERLLAVLGASQALGDHLVRHPGHLAALQRSGLPDAPAIREALLAPVRQALADTVRTDAADEVDGARAAAYDALRTAYRRELLAVAGHDLTAPAQREALPAVAAALADMAASALEAALLIAQHVVAGAGRVRLGVIGMGKCGGRELNYVSDVDVIFVAEPAEEQVDEDEALEIGTRVASELMRACSASTGEGSLWPVDPNLRPEGRNGPLVRTLASHHDYYRQWARTWEFQALLKARHVAGDEQLTQQWLDDTRPLVWEAASRENFVEDVQAMRRRVEENVPAKEADRQLKLGAGGIRDVEFSVQLLQLVHGRADDSLHSGTTLDALAALREGGYIARDDADALDEAYRTLRVLEHRIQSQRLRRTHLMPTAEADLRRLGRSVGLRADADREVVELWRAQARIVRRLHERIFYRPLLSAVARLSTDEARLSPEAAQARLRALGFADPAGAMRHLEVLTAGVSRRAAIQRQLLPAMLGWFADGPAPDAGLLAFRRLSEDLGTTHWYLKMLRDEGRAAERLAHILSTSRWSTELLLRAPESVSLLGEGEAGLVPLGRDALVARMRAAAQRGETPSARMQAARAVRRHELLRITLADLTGGATLETTARALTDLTEALIEVGLETAVAAVAAERGEAMARIAVLGLGRLGGAELGYASDADVMYVYDPLGDDDGAAHEEALAVIRELGRLFTESGPDPQLELDADLRPEGRSGPLVRSLDSLREYYGRWSSAWEAQALVRLRPVAGDADLGAEVVRLVEPLRHPRGGLAPAHLREMRLLKARMEGERIPRGGDPHRHYKLGRGGLSDVEWTVQLLQMQHGHEHPALRTTSTTAALTSLQQEGLLDDNDAAQLRSAWRLVSGLRDAGLLWRGRAQDQLPGDVRDLEGTARALGRPPGSGASLAEDYLRLTRRARAVVDRLFFGQASEAPGAWGRYGADTL